jgi:C-terminal processing protease CtpA/Prc
VRTFFGTMDAGVVVRNVYPQSNAAAIGLRENDVITAIDGKPVDGVKDLEAVMSKKHGAVQKTDLTLLRDQEQWSLAMVVQPGKTVPASSVTQKMIEERNGITDSAMRGDGSTLPTLLNGSAAQPMPQH